MPFGDGTGPMGQGPMTGRGMGYCAGYVTPGWRTGGGGRGRGWWGRGGGGGGGRGGGRGWRHWFYATGVPGWARGRMGGWWGGAVPPAPGFGPMAAPTAEQEAEALRDQAQYFKDALGDIEKRIEELEAKETER